MITIQVGFVAHPSNPKDSAAWTTTMMMNVQVHSEFGLYIFSRTESSASSRGDIRLAKWIFNREEPVVKTINLCLPSVADMKAPAVEQSRAER